MVYLSFRVVGRLLAPVSLDHVHGVKWVFVALPVNVDTVEGFTSVLLGDVLQNPLDMVHVFAVRLLIVVAVSDCVHFCVSCLLFVPFVSLLYHIVRTMSIGKTD